MRQLSLSMSSAVFVWGVNVLGLALIADAALGLFSTPVPVVWLAFAIPALVSGATVLRLPSASTSFSVGDAFSFGTLFLLGTDAAILTVALDSLAIALRLGTRPVRTAFNVAAPCLAMWCAGFLVYDRTGIPLPVETASIGPALLSAAAAVAIMFVVDSALVSIAVALHEGRSIAALWWNSARRLWANPVACGYAGLLMAVVVERYGGVELLAIVPIPLILYFGFRAALGRLEDHTRHLSDLSRLYHSTIEAFAGAVDAKDQVTHGHIRRVQQYCLALAHDMGMSDPEDVRGLEAAALLHDIGKIGVAESILNKPGKLDPAEFEAMKRHVDIGVAILETVDFPFPVVPIVRSHHENWDGSGYPAGLAGDAIPLGARILSVVDCFDALTSDRPYRRALTVEQAIAEVTARRGVMYDPAVVERFVALQPRLSPPEVGPKPSSAPHPPAVAPPPPPSASASARADAIAALAAAALPGHLCVVYRTELETQSVVACAARGPGAERVGDHRMGLGHGVSGWVASGGGRIDSDALLDVPPPRGAWLTGWRCGAVLIAGAQPLVITLYGPPAQEAARGAALSMLHEAISTCTPPSRSRS